ncbi:MAG: hypothetical protein ABIW30_04305 [Arenimonas sp.]
MPYREKTAWLSLIAMALTFGPYFAIVAQWGPVHGDVVANLGQLGLYAKAALSQVVLLGLGHLILRRGSPEEARTPPDERDLAIMRRSTTFAYYVLIAGVIQVGVIMPFLFTGWAIVNAALCMIVAAEIVRYAVVVASYRRQT